MKNVSIISWSSDEIEDVTDEALDKMIKDGETLAVLFCTYRSYLSHNRVIIGNSLLIIILMYAFRW